jgi:hypothetical protein
LSNVWIYRIGKLEMSAGKARKLITPLLILIPSAVLVGSLAVYIHLGASEEPPIPAVASLPQPTEEQDKPRLRFTSAAIRVAHVHAPTAARAPRKTPAFTRVAAAASDSDQPELEANGGNARANDLLDLFKQTLQALVAENAALTQNVSELQAALRDSRKALAAANARNESEKRNIDQLIEKHKAASAAAKKDAEASATRYRKLLAEHQVAVKATQLVKELQAELRQSREELAAAQQHHGGEQKEKDRRIAELEAISNSARQNADALAERHLELSRNFQTAISARQKAETALSETNKKLLDIEKKHQQMLAALDEVLQPKRAREAALARQRLSEQVQELSRQRDTATKLAADKLAAFDRDAGSATSTLSSASDDGARVAGALEKMNQDWDGVIQSASEVSESFDKADAEIKTNAGVLAKRAEVLRGSEDAVQQDGAKLDQIANGASNLEKTKTSIGSRLDDLLTSSRQVDGLSKSVEAAASALAAKVDGLGRTLRGGSEPGATRAALSDRDFMLAQEELRNTTSNAQVAAKLLSQLVTAKTKLKDQLLPVTTQIKELSHQVSASRRDLLSYTDELESLTERLMSNTAPAAGQIERSRAKLQGYAGDIGEKKRLLSAMQLELAELNKGLDAAEVRVRLSADQFKSARADLSDGLAQMKKVQLATEAMKTTINSFAQTAADSAKKATLDQLQTDTSVLSEIGEQNRELQRQAMREVTETQAAITKAIEGFNARLGHLGKLETELQASNLKLAKLKKALAKRMRDVADQEPRYTQLQDRQKALLARNETLDEARRENKKRTSLMLKKASLLKDRLPVLQSQIQAGSFGEDANTSIASVRSRIAMEPVDEWRLRLTEIDKQLGELSVALESRRPEPAPIPVRAPPLPKPPPLVETTTTVPVPVAKPKQKAVTAIVEPGRKPVAVKAEDAAKKVKAPVAVKAEDAAKKVKAPVAARAEDVAKKVKAPVAVKAEDAAKKVKAPVAARAEDVAKKVKAPVAAKAEDVAQKVKAPVPVKAEDEAQKVKAPVPVKAEDAAKKSQEPVAAVAEDAIKKSKKTPAAGSLECNRSRPSCRRWLFLRKKRLQLNKGTNNVTSQLPAN